MGSRGPWDIPISLLSPKTAYSDIFSPVYMIYKLKWTNLNSSLLYWGYVVSYGLVKDQRPRDHMRNFSKFGNFSRIWTFFPKLSGFFSGGQMVLFPKGEQLFPTFLLQKIFENSRFFSYNFEIFEIFGNSVELIFHIIKASLLFTATVLKQIVYFTKSG